MGSRSNSDNKANVRVEIPVRQKPDGTYEARGNKRVTIPVQQQKDGSYKSKAEPRIMKADMRMKRAEHAKSDFKFNKSGTPVDMNITGPHKLKSGKLYE